MQVLFWFAGLLMVFAAAALGVIAWRSARGTRDRELARAELLRALSFPGASAEPTSDPSIPDWTSGLLREQQSAPAVNAHEPLAPIFAEHAESATALPRWVSLAAVGVAMALGVAFYVLIAGRPEAASATGAGATAAAMTSAAVNDGAPIELIALRHRVERATTFDVSGRVRNPYDGRTQREVVAIVNLIGADGRVLSSQTTPLEQPVLEAGQTSTFSVVFPRVTGSVARYQVGFRVRSGDTVPHVDRRATEARAKAPAP